MSDLLLQATADGLNINLESTGEPTLSAGLDNAVYQSLFTEEWWANDIAESSEKYISTIPQIMKEGILTNQTRLDIIEAAKTALQWMKDDKMTDRIEVNATIPASGTLYLSVTIYEPNREGQNFAYALNWEDQKIRIMEAT